MDYVRAWDREEIREVVPYCPDLDISHFQNIWGRILKRFFSKLLNKKAWLLCIQLLRRTILELYLVTDPTKPNFTDASSKSLRG